MTEKKKVEIVFAPGCFDNFDGTQEELDQMMADIQQMVESGEIFEKSVPLSDESIDNLDDATLAQLASALGIDLDDEPNNKTLH